MRFLDASLRSTLLITMTFSFRLSQCLFRCLRIANQCTSASGRGVVCWSHIIKSPCINIFLSCVIHCYRLRMYFHALFPQRPSWRSWSSGACADNLESRKLSQYSCNIISVFLLLYHRLESVVTLQIRIRGISTSTSTLTGWMRKRKLSWCFLSLEPRAPQINQKS